MQIACDLRLRVLGARGLAARLATAGHFECGFGVWGTWDVRKCTRVRLRGASAEMRASDSGDNWGIRNGRAKGRWRGAQRLSTFRRVGDVMLDHPPRAASTLVLLWEIGGLASPPQVAPQASWRTSWKKNTGTATGWVGTKYEPTRRWVRGSRHLPLLRRTGLELEASHAQRSPSPATGHNDVDTRDTDTWAWSSMPWPGCRLAAAPGLRLEVVANL